MHIQIDLIGAQLIERPDGSVEVLGQKGFVVLHADYARSLKDTYRQFIKAYPEKSSLKIVVNVEIPQPVGGIVNKG